MKTRIIVDSTADLVPEIKARVSTVPLTVHFGQEEYIDGVTIDNKTFYEKLIESDVLPTTSQATPDAFIKEFEKAKQEGESAVVITLASKFSGTYQSAMIAAADYENIYVVDGTSAAMGTGILVELAFRLLDAGMTAEETAQALEEEKKQIEQEVKVYMEDAERADSENYSVTWKSVTSNRVDSKKLKSVYPEIYKECVKPAPSRRFVVKEIA